MFFAYLLPLSHHLVITIPVHNISFSKIVFDLRGVPFVFQARHGSFQPIIPPNSEPRFTERILSSISALGSRYSFPSVPTPNCLYFPWHTCYTSFSIFFPGLLSSSFNFVSSSISTYGLLDLQVDNTFSWRLDEHVSAFEPKALFLKTSGYTCLYHTLSTTGAWWFSLASQLFPSMLHFSVSSLLSARILRRRLAYLLAHSLFLGQFFLHFLESS